MDVLTIDKIANNVMLRFAIIVIIYGKRLIEMVKTPRGKLRIQPIMPKWFPGLKQVSLGGNRTGFLDSSKRA